MKPTVLPDDDERRIRQAQEERVAVALAHLGWITPIWIRAAQLETLLGTGEADEVDAAFVEFYSGDGFARYERLMRELSRPDTARWANLITQMDNAYRRRDYVIVVPAALVLLEGILTRGQEAIENLRMSVRGRVPSPPKGYSLHRVMWLAASEFVEQLYSRHDFDGDAPPSLNRHWILHGRIATDWSQGDALRLLQACYVASYLVMNAS